MRVVNTASFIKPQVIVNSFRKPVDMLAGIPHAAGPVSPVGPVGAGQELPDSLKPQKPTTVARKHQHQETLPPPVPLAPPSATATSNKELKQKIRELLDLIRD